MMKTPVILIVSRKFPLCTTQIYQLRFLGRIDRYTHELEDDTDDTDDSPVFGLFSSCSPQYRKVSKFSSTSTETDSNGESTSTPKIAKLTDFIDLKPKKRSGSGLQNLDKEKPMPAEQRKVVKSFILVSSFF